MNLPNSVVRHVFATVVLLFGSMAYVPERFPNNCDDRRLGDHRRQAQRAGWSLGWVSAVDSLGQNSVDTLGRHLAELRSR